MATKVVKILTIAEINALPLKERQALYKDSVVVPFKAIGNAQKKFTSGMHVAGKVHASLKREYVALLALGLPLGLPAGTSEKEFFGTNCGGVPSGRVLAVSTFFNVMCMTPVTQTVCDAAGKPVLKDGKPQIIQKPLLDETTQFDPHSGNSLEIADACIAAERKLAPDAWMGTDNTLDVIAAMSTPGDATTKLKEIRARQKAKKESTDGDGDGAANAPLTIASCIAFLLAAIGNAGAMLETDGGAEVASDLFKSTYFDMGAAWQNSGVTDETMQQWTSNIERGVAPLMEIKI